MLQMSGPRARPGDYDPNRPLIIDALPYLNQELEVTYLSAGFSSVFVLTNSSWRGTRDFRIITVMRGYPTFITLICIHP